MAGIAFGAPSNLTTHSIDLAPVYTNGTVSVEHLSVAGNLDGFKMVTPAARKSADFWYFDVFSSASNQTLNIVFFNSGEFSQYPHPLAVQVSGVYANGTSFYFEALADLGVSLTNGPDGITGEWKGIGSFKGSALDEPNVEYTINLDSPQMDIYGTIVFKSVGSSLANITASLIHTKQQIAPSHYPCELNGAVGANQNLLPSLYWANAVPDANTVVELQVSDTTISFNDGVGYHDKNWGNKSIIDVPRYWDWGHGRLGPYSVVWYNLLDYNGNESRRSFVTKDGEVLLVSCSSDALIVRQKGGQAAWPPTTGLLETEGLSINYTLPDGEIFAIDVTTELIVRDESGAYQRANGLLKGGFVGKETIEGRAHYEEFIFGIVNNYTPSV
ncbi:Tyrosinase family protein asqI [Diaporthe amygdali]|uniref:Tyrosinase family protein asqI n=1 Tax=Phomopsis amygdali TaxID=1214568 RepID=UPI0022FEC202|nr:Tyrosinase family protein asqI [Diaporthe amygdali]KAJ0120182.1 Tyrosinase family protein asqI [Diaporthe amygdali]